VQLGFLPLVEQGLVDIQHLIADAKSGVSGAGRKAEVHTLFAEGGPWVTAWGHTLYLPDPTSFQWLPASLALASAIALIRFKANVLLVIGVCALAGAAPLLGSLA
jgi:N-acetyl-gamma-glutamyl-phosphate reductase